MASTPKRWLWLVNVAAVILGTWLMAGTVDAMIAARMSAAGAPAPAQQRAGALFGSNGSSSKPVDFYLDPIKSKNVFNHGEPVPDEEIVASADPAVSSAPPDACTVPINVLSAVIVPKHPELSLVTYSDNSVSPQPIYVAQVGERIANVATVISVSDDFDDETLVEVSSVELQRDDGRHEICRSGDAGAPHAVVASMAMPNVGGGTPPGEGIKRVGDDKFEVSQSTIDGVMNGGLGQLAQDVRIVPYYEGGVSKGFKMYSIRPGSLLAQIGLMNGDVVEKINGYDLNSPEKALQVYGLLKNEKNISVDVSRNGQNKSISYTIR